MRISGRGISDEIIFYCQRKSSGASAKGCFIVGGFKVFKGSKVSSYICSNLKADRYKPFYKMRLKLEDERIIADGIFQSDYVFSSASLASMVVLGASSNGNHDWRTEDGVTLGVIHSGSRVVHRKPCAENPEGERMKSEIFTASRDDSESARLILTKYFPNGFNTKINLDYMKFRNYAESEGIAILSENESLRRIIESEGTNLDGSIFIISKELSDETGRLISAIQDTKADVIFYFPLMNELTQILNQNHIYSLERTAEGKYFFMSNFYVTSRESTEIYRYAEEACKADGYASIVNIPCESVRAISLFMAGEKFIPIRGITTFAAFPDCGEKWNHYILESFCYRFSGKYELRFFAEDSSRKLTYFNNSSMGIITERNLDMTYSEMLSEMLSRRRFEITEENAGKYFHDAGLMKRKKFTGLREILSRAKRLREGRY